MVKTLYGRCGSLPIRIQLAGVRIGAGVGVPERWESRQQALPELSQHLTNKRLVPVGPWLRLFEVDTALEYLPYRLEVLDNHGERAVLSLADGQICKRLTTLFESHLMALALGLNKHDVAPFGQLWRLCLRSVPWKVAEEQGLVKKLQDVFLALEIAVHHIWKWHEEDQAKVALAITGMLRLIQEEMDKTPIPQVFRAWINSHTIGIGHLLNKQALYEATHGRFQLEKVVRNLNSVVEIALSQMASHCGEILAGHRSYLDSRLLPARSSTPGDFTSGGTRP